MAYELDPVIEKYIEIYDKIRERTGHDGLALVIFQQVIRDMRKKENTNTADSSGPATEKQINYLKRLGVLVPENLTKQRASKFIERAEEIASKRAYN